MSSALSAVKKESVKHFALDCQHTKQILGRLGIQLSGITELEDIFSEAKKRISDTKIYACDLVITAVYWTIWLARNGEVFDDEELPTAVVAR